MSTSTQEVLPGQRKSKVSKGGDKYQASDGVKGTTLSKNSTQTFEEQLEQEVRYRDTVIWSVSVLEQSVKDLEKQLQLLKNGEGDEDSEYRLRCETQRDLNKKLEEQVEFYEEDVRKMEERAKQGHDCKFDSDLNNMTEFELAKLLRHLERERNNLYGDLRNKSWQLDTQSQEYHKCKEVSKAYTGDMIIANRDLQQIWRKRSKAQESGFAESHTPVTSPASLVWSGEAGIKPFQRILDPKKGPIRKTAGVRSLPRLDQSGIGSKKSGGGRSKSMAHSRSTKSQENLARPSRWSVQEASKSKTFLNGDTTEYSSLSAKTLSEA